MCVALFGLYPPLHQDPTLTQKRTHPPPPQKKKNCVVDKAALELHYSFCQSEKCKGHTRARQQGQAGLAGRTGLVEDFGNCKRKLPCQRFVLHLASLHHFLHVGTLEEEHGEESGSQSEIIFQWGNLVVVWGEMWDQGNSGEFFIQNPKTVQISPHIAPLHH